MRRINGDRLFDVNSETQSKPVPVIAYRFRRNILNGKVEFAVLPKAENKAEGNEGCLNRMGEMTGEIKGISPVLNPLCTKAFRKMTGEMMDFP